MDAHEKLRRKLDLFPVGLPQTDDTRRILELLFPGDDARVAAALSLPPVLMNAAKAARKAGVSRREARERLRRMADRGLIIGQRVLGEDLYVLMPAAPGFLEMQFMHGQEFDENRREAGRLWHAALHGPYGEENYAHPTSGVRVVPIHKAIPAGQKVFRFEEMEQIIRASGAIALTDCACRKSAANPCGGPVDDMCMMFSVSAEYLISRGMARRATMKDAMAALERGADAGLVPTTTNTAAPVQIVCHCCRCCCASLQGVTALGKPAAAIRSNFCATAAEPASCIQCRLCEKSCPVEALRVYDSGVSVDEDRCIGCGVCVHKCNNRVLALRRKSNNRPAATPLGLVARMMDERGKAPRLIRTLIEDIF